METSIKEHAGSVRKQSCHPSTACFLAGRECLEDFCLHKIELTSKIKTLVCLV